MSSSSALKVIGIFFTTTVIQYQKISYVSIIILYFEEIIWKGYFRRTDMSQGHENNPPYSPFRKGG